MKHLGQHRRCAALVLARLRKRRRRAGFPEPRGDHHQPLRTRRLRRAIAAAGLRHAQPRSGSTRSSSRPRPAAAPRSRPATSPSKSPTVTACCTRRSPPTPSPAACSTGLKYHPVTSFTPISGVSTSPYLVLVNAASPIRTIADLVAHAKANPGKINYGSSGAGTGPHLTGEILKQSLGIDTVHISFKGAAPANTALLGGHIDYLVTEILGARAGPVRTVAGARCLQYRSLALSARRPDSRRNSHQGLRRNQSPFAVRSRRHGPQADRRHRRMQSARRSPPTRSRKPTPRSASRPTR